MPTTRPKLARVPQTTNTPGITHVGIIGAGHGGTALMEKSWLGVTVKESELVAAPAEVVNVIGPVIAPWGTMAVIAVEVTELMIAVAPLNATLLSDGVAELTFVPVMVTAVPTGPLAGENPVMVGAETTIKFWALVAIPPGV